MFRISQTSTVLDYVEQFSELFDQLTAYEETPDPLHYLTRFVDGLNPPIRMAVALQNPRDLDDAYDLTLLHEELGEVPDIVIAPVPSRRAQPQPLPLPPPPPRSRAVEERRSAEDKWVALRNYRKSKDLCFLCGERWSKDHKCQQSVQLHFVQELIDHSGQFCFRVFWPTVFSVNSCYGQGLFCTYFPINIAVAA